MRCRECRALLWSYIDRDLPDARRQAVDDHLAGCIDCAVAHERLRAFPLQPGQLAIAAPPPDFTARLMQRIDVLPPPRELAHIAERNAPFHGPVGAILAFSTAAAAVLLGLLSTSALALLSGRALPLSPTAANDPAGGAANALGGWLANEVWLLLSWPVLLALWGMLLVLAMLWFRLVVRPRRRLPIEWGDDPGRNSRRQRRP